MNTNTNNDQGMTAIEADEDAVVFMSMDQKPTKQPHIWIGDTGASCHMTYSLDGMSKLCQSNMTITFGDGKSITSQQIGIWQGYVSLLNVGSSVLLWACLLSQKRVLTVLLSPSMFQSL